MPAWIAFAGYYLRNLIAFDCDPVRTLACTRMDMDLRRYRKTHPQKGPQP